MGLRRLRRRAESVGQAGPPTAQHAARQGMQAGRHIAVAVRGDPARSVCTATRRSASSRRSGASGGGDPVRRRFSGFIAGPMWRGAYLLTAAPPEESPCIPARMPEICFPRDMVQLLTAESVRSRWIDEPMDSARVADSADKVPQP